MLYVFDSGTISLRGNCLTWKVYNFFTLPLSVGCEIRSLQFIYGDSRYSLYIWPRGHKGSGTEEWLGICLYKYDAPGIGDSVQFSIATDLGNIKTCKVKCSENNLFRQERFIEWTDFLILKHKLAPDGCLTIVCKLFIENSQRNYRERFKTLSQDFKNLYLTGMDFDLTITMEGKEFRVLKAILKARSPDFIKWLLENATENTNNIITIEPFDACNSSVFHDFLLYIYSGEVENLTEANNYGLYCAAEKFQMPELKEECMKHLQNSISIDNITNISNR